MDAELVFTSLVDEMCVMWRDELYVVGVLTADQKPAALASRHVDRIGELMEDDDDDDDDKMTSDICRRSLDKHDRHVVGGPSAADAALPQAGAGDSHVDRSDAGIGCHGDADERDEAQRLTGADEEPLLTRQQQQSATGGYSPSHYFLFVCLYIFLSICLCVFVCTCVDACAAATEPYQHVLFIIMKSLCSVY